LWRKSHEIIATKKIHLFDRANIVYLLSGKAFSLHKKENKKFVLDLKAFLFFAFCFVTHLSLIA